MSIRTLRGAATNPEKLRRSYRSKEAVLIITNQRDWISQEGLRCTGSMGRNRE